MSSEAGVTQPYHLADTVEISKYLAVQVSAIAKCDAFVTHIVQKVEYDSADLGVLTDR